MATITEGPHTGEFLASEANGTRSRATVTLTGVNGVAGLVLGMITASKKYTEYNPANTDGSETAVAVLYDNVDASSADRTVVAIRRDAEIKAAALTWFAGASAGQIETGTAELATQGLIAR